MRPKKRVLLWGVGLETMQFAVATRGYRARVACEHMGREIAEFRPDAVMLCPDRCGEALLSGLEEAQAAEVPILTVSQSRRAPQQAGGVVLWGPPTMLEVMEALRVLCARKRGPKRAGSLHAAITQRAGQAAARLA